MPMLWKKESLSQMVADLRSPKRRRSMVVQTGFPTSLIDLFVKNRDRLKKKNHPRQKNSRFHPVDPVNDTNVNSSSGSCTDKFCRVDPVNDTISNSIYVVNRTDDLSSVDPVNDNILNSSSVSCTDEEEDLSAVQIEKHEDDRAVCNDPVAGELPRGGFSSVLAAMVFAMVGLAVFTSTKLAVGVTLLAFVLLFLECVSKPFGCLVMKTWSDAKSRLGRAILVLRSVIAREKSEGVVFELVEESGAESECSNEEIEEVASMDGEKVEVIDHGHLCKKSRSGRKAKMGAMFMKRLVSKKSWLSSKKHEAETVPEPMPKASVEEESENILENKCDKQEGDGIVTSSIGEKKGAEYLVLFSIALAGLVGGRVLALLLTITWCIVLKFIMCWSRSGSARMPVSMKRCSLAISL